MNKTISVNIRGIIFNIEEEAYQLLSTYLESLKSYLGKSAARDEIIGDIESRIAELFSMKITDRNQVVTLAEVENVIVTLGQPEQYMLDDEDLEPDPQESKTQEEPAYDPAETQKLKRRVFRNPDDKIAGGVMSGFAAYFDVDPLWWRLAFVVIFFLGIGSPVFLYLILWIIIPEAKTRAEKLQMRGEAVTLESLKRTVEEETEHIRKKAAGLTDDSAAEKFRTGVQEIFHFFETALRWLIKGIAKLFGAVLILGGAAMTVVMVIATFFGTTSIGPDNNTDKQMFDTLFGWFPSTQSDANLIQYGGLILIVSASLLAFTLGMRLLSRQPEQFRKYRVSLVLFCTAIVGGTMLAVGASHTAMDYRQQEVISERKVVKMNGDTISLSVNPTNLFTKLSRHRGLDNFGQIRITENTIYSKEIRLDIQRVDSLRDVEIKMETYAQGKSNLDAIKRARNIKYSYTADSTGTVVFEPFFTYDLKDKYRGQQIDITIYLPEGKSIYLSPDIEEYIYDLRNVSDTWDREMVGHTWKMTTHGLSCPDFPKEVVR